MASPLALAWRRLLPAERAAIVLALVPALLLGTPWLRVTSEPLCVLPPCPEPQTHEDPGYATATAVVLAGAALVAATVLLAMRNAEGGRLLAAALVTGASLFGLAAPDWPSIHVFEHVSGAGWGYAATLAAMAAVLAALAAAQLQRRPAATAPATEGLR